MLIRFPACHFTNATRSQAYFHLPAYTYWPSSNRGHVHQTSPQAKSLPLLHFPRGNPEPLPNASVKRLVSLFLTKNHFVSQVFLKLNLLFECLPLLESIVEHTSQETVFNDGPDSSSLKVKLSVKCSVACWGCRDPSCMTVIYFICMTLYWES